MDAGVYVVTIKATLAALTIWAVITLLFLAHTIQKQVKDKAFEFAIECVKSGGTYTKGECTR